MVYKRVIFSNILSTRIGLSTTNQREPLRKKLKEYLVEEDNDQENNTDSDTAIIIVL